jgi:hypothetical protein
MKCWKDPSMQDVDEYYPSRNVFCMSISNSCQAHYPKIPKLEYIDWCCPNTSYWPILKLQGTPSMQRCPATGIMQAPLIATMIPKSASPCLLYPTHVVGSKQFPLLPNSICLAEPLPGSVPTDRMMTTTKKN